MIHSAERPRTTLPQAGLALLAVLALAFSLFTLAQPVRADHVAGSTVQLNQDLGEGVSGESPGEFAGDAEECAGVEEGTVLFHFVANQLAEGTTVTGSSLTAEFDQGTKTVDGYSPSGDETPSTIHFDVVLTGDEVDWTLLDASAHFAIAQTESTNLLLSHICGGGEGEENGQLEVDKFFCPTEGETRTEFDVFGPAEPQASIQSEQAPEDGCSVGADVSFTVLASDGTTVVTTFTTDASGTALIELEAGSYILREDASGATVAFTIAEGQITAIVVVNYVAEEEQGQLKILKYFCEADEAGTTFYPEGEAPNLEDCEPGDAEFTIDDGEAFSTTDGIAVVNLDAGTGYVLTEVSSEASTEFDIVAGEITTIIVVNNVVIPEENGQLEVEKFFCPTEGETRTEFDVFGPTEPMASIQEENEVEDGCSVGADVAFTVLASDGETVVTTFVTDESGMALIELEAGSYILHEDASGAEVAFEVAAGQITAIVVVNYVAEEVQPGILEVEKFFCPTDGETRTEFDVFGPTDPMPSIQQEQDEVDDSCTVGADVSFTLYSVGEEWVEIDTLVTDESGMIEIELAPGDYALCEDMSEECVEFSIGEGQFTAIVVVNYVAAPQGQIKILKYFCDAEEDSVEFYLEGQAPNLENCDPGDAEFTLDDGEAFSTEGGIAVIWADEGTHTLAEAGTDASVELEVVEGEITTVIVLNNVAPEEEQGQLVIDKWFCEGDEVSTSFYLEGDEPDLTGCEPGDAMFTIDDGEAFSTVEGTAIVNLDADTGYLLTEVSSEASFEFDIAAGETTTVIVVNEVESQEGAQGQVKVLKYLCESDESGVEFVLEGDAPADLEDCDPADAEFMLDEGEAWSTTDGIAIVWADEGTHTLTEVSTEASVEIEVVAGAITTVIVLNHVESATEGETGGNQPGGQPGGEGAVLGGQGGPGGGTLPDTATDPQGPGLPAALLALLAVAGLGGLGAMNVQAVRRRMP